MAELYDGGMHIADLMFRLRTVSIHPGTDTKLIVLPS